MQPEAKLKMAIIEAMQAAGHFAFRNEQGSRRNKRLGCGIGSPDIFVVLRPSGRLVGLEAKIGKRAPTPEQARWGHELAARGGIYAVVRSVEEAIAALGPRSLVAVYDSAGDGPRLIGYRRLGDPDDATLIPPDEVPP